VLLGRGVAEQGGVGPAEEHAALARCILGMMSHETGFDFASRVDACGGNTWFAHKHATPENAGFTPIKSATQALTLSDLPRTLHGPIFPIGVDSLEWYWRKACRLAGIPDLKFHDLRHEGVSRLFERGLTAEEVMQVSGHRTYAMLARYTHLRSAGLIDKLG
jgi:hypothetical protein